MIKFERAYTFYGDLNTIYYKLFRVTDPQNDLCSSDYYRILYFLKKFKEYIELDNDIYKIKFMDMYYLYNKMTKMIEDIESDSKVLTMDDIYKITDWFCMYIYFINQSNVDINFHEETKDNDEEK